MRYKVHKLKVNMLNSSFTYSPPKHIYLIDKDKFLDEFLNELRGEVIAIIPNTDSTVFGFGEGVNYLFVIEKETTK